MSTKRLTLRNETFQRASDQVQVLASKQINKKITPSQIRLDNSKYIILENVAGDADSYIVRDGSDNLLITNLLSTGGEIWLVHTMASGNQRYLLFKEYGATDTQAIQTPYDLHIVTENDNIYLRPATDVIIPAMPTTDPAVDGALWDDLGDVKISTGTATKNYCFASIHNHDTLTAQSIPTGTTYTKLTNFTDNGLSLNCTAAAASDKITITTTGYYHVAGSFNFFCGTNNVTWRIAPFLNGVEQEEIHVMRKIGTASDIGSASFVGIIDVTSVPWDLDIRTRHDNGSAVTLTVEYANLTIHKIAPT